MGGGGREIKISRNYSRDTYVVVNYCPPKKTGADRSSHKQQLRIEITLGTPPPDPHTASRPQPNTAPAHGPHHQARGRLTTNAQRGPAYHPAERPQSRRENHRCVCLVFSGPPPAIWSPNPCLPRTRGTQRPQSLACSQPSHPKHIRPRHTRTHKAPSKLCQTQSMQWGRACHRTKATRLFCRLKFRGYPMQSITSPHRVIPTTVDLKHGTGTWAAPAGPGGGGGTDHKRAKGPGIPPGGKTPKSAGEPPLCLFRVPRGFPARWSPNPCVPQDPRHPAPTNVSHVHNQTTPSTSGPGTRARTMLQRNCAKRKACNGDEHAIASRGLGGSAGSNSVDTQCTPTTSPHCVILITVDRKSLFCVCSQVRARSDTICAPATCKSVTKTKNLQPNRLASLTAQHNPHSSG